MVHNKLQDITAKLITENFELKPRIEWDNSDLETVEYFKNEISKGNHTPILISEDDGEIIDGNHRVVAYHMLGIEPPLLYWGNRNDFFNAVAECDYDGIKAVEKMIADGTATKIDN